MLKVNKLMNKSNILIATTKAITMNIFLDMQINFFVKKKYNVFLLNSDIINLNRNIDEIISHNNKIQIELPRQIFELLNIYKFLQTIRKLRKVILNKRIEIIYTHTPLISHLIRIATFGLKCEIVYFVHGFRFNRQTQLIKFYFFLFIEKILSYNTSKYILVNNEDLQITNKYFKKRSLKINGVGIDLINKKIINKNLKKNIIIGVIAAYRDNKGYKDLIKIANVFSDIIFECFGYDNPKKYIELCKKKNVTNINFNSFQSDIYSKIDTFTFLITLSEREGLPISVVQSLHRGKPVIGYNIRGLNDLIVNGQNGYLAKFKDLNEIIILINKMISNSSNYNILCLNAYSSINYSYSKDSISNLVLKYIYDHSK